MCAINGFNFKNLELLTKMNLATKHRGPDFTSAWESDAMSFGHNRLSIIDVSSGSNQPMVSRDNSHVFTYNGEIYNFKELKRELENDYKFSTEGDTEVILAAYKKWGSKMLERFNGIYAIAIWDKNKEELFLARDKFGVKPLYYYQDGEKFFFSSEIKAILESGVDRVINPQVLPHYFNLLYVPGEQTMFKGINRFPPNSFGLFKNGKLEISKCGEKVVEVIPSSIVEAMDRSVSYELVSDRPVGLYLSGGLDSSVLLHSMSKLNSQVKTFSVGFDIRDDEEREKFNADFFLARKTAKLYKSDHSEIMINSRDLASAFERAIWHLDEPVSNSTIIPMIVLSEFAKSKVSVVLSGDGGDELYGGYERYRMSRIIDAYRVMPAYIRNLFSSTELGEKLNTQTGTDRIKRFMFQKEKILSRLLDANVDLQSTYKFFENNFKIEANEDATDHMMRVDQATWLVDEALLRADKLSMAFGLESRVPFLNNVSKAFSDRLPVSRKVGLLKTKKIIREEYRGILPGYLINQPKRGWFSPGAKWLRDKEFLNYAKDIIFSDSDLPIDKREMEKMFDEHISKTSYHLNTIWPVLTLKLWQRIFKTRL